MPSTGKARSLLTACTTAASAHDGGGALSVLALPFAAVHRLLRIPAADLRPSSQLIRPSFLGVQQPRAAGCRSPCLGEAVMEERHEPRAAGGGGQAAHAAAVAAAAATLLPPPAELASWSVRQLKDFLEARGVNCSTCVGKEELVALAQEAAQAPTPPAACAAATSNRGSASTSSSTSRGSAAPGAGSRSDPAQVTPERLQQLRSSLSPELSARAVSTAREAALLHANWRAGIGGEAEAARMRDVYAQAVALLGTQGCTAFCEHHNHMLLMVSTVGGQLVTVRSAAGCGVAAAGAQPTGCVCLRPPSPAGAGRPRPGPGPQRGRAGAA